MLTLNAKIKENKVSNEMLRSKGEIPAVYYGFGKESTPITINTVDFLKVFREAGESTPVSLKTTSDSVNVLIHEIQFDPLKGIPIHVDFLVIDMNKKVVVMVPLEFDGVAPAAKSGVGVFVKVLHEVEVEALPTDLPHAIHISLEKLQAVNDNITVGEIVVPKGVLIITKETEIVASIAAQIEEKEEVAPVDLSAIEVEKKGKKEEGAESASE